jgi:hypothetical protein
MRSRLMPSRCSTFSAALHRFQPGGLCAPVTDGRRGMVTTLPSGSTAPVFRSLRIGELAIGRVCGGRPVQRQARCARACEGEPSGRPGVSASTSCCSANIFSNPPGVTPTTNTPGSVATCWKECAVPRRTKTMDRAALTMRSPSLI